ncbi:hypothetical protein EMIT043CA1_50144 [Pseudomonas brassicacearum]
MCRSSPITRVVCSYSFERQGPPPLLSCLAVGLPRAGFNGPIERRYANGAFIQGLEPVHDHLPLSSTIPFNFRDKAAATDPGSGPGRGDRPRLAQGRRYHQTLSTDDVRG